MPTARKAWAARQIAISGTNFRVKDDPAGATATLRYYQKLATPSGATVNAILTGYPDVYLFGCLIEAAIFTQDEPGRSATCSSTTPASPGSTRAPSASRPRPRL